MINPELANVAQKIDRLLRERRPDRYTISGHDEDDTTLGAEEVETTSWLDSIAEDVEALIPEATVRRLYARTLVGQREARTTQNGNRALRNIDRTGQEPLTWDWLDEPITVESRVTQPGERIKVIKERVALRAASAEDLRAFAIEERRRAGKDFATRNATCENAEWIADQMTESGTRNLATWAKYTEEDE